jgi:hypothetical protein
LRFILTANGFAPTDGALFKHFEQQVTEIAVNNMTDTFISWLSIFGTWFADRGLTMLAEGMMIFSLFCFLMAITGQGKWMERGVKSLIGFVLFGGAAHAF